MSAFRSPILDYFPIRAGADLPPRPGAPPPPTGVSLFARYALAGAACCSITHGALTPVDVVKTRMQLEPEVYNRVRRPIRSPTGRYHFFSRLCVANVRR